MQLEELLQEYKNVCILRVRMPITSDLTNPRNFITKISRYQKVGEGPTHCLSGSGGAGAGAGSQLGRHWTQTHIHMFWVLGQVVNIPNSMTVLDELLPISIEMAKRELRGIYNFTNPGCVSHNEVLELYRDYIDPAFKWQNFTLEEQVRRNGRMAEWQNGRMAERGCGWWEGAVVWKGLLPIHIVHLGWVHFGSINIGQLNEELTRFTGSVECGSTMTPQSLALVNGGEGGSKRRSQSWDGKGWEMGQLM